MFVLLFVQAAVLFVFAAGCFGSVFSARLTADDLFEGEGLIESSPDGGGIGVYGEYNAGAYYEILYTDNYSLRPGAYDITVEYAVTRDDTLPEDSQPVALGMVELRGDQRDHMLWDGDIYLVDWRETQTQRLWVSFPYRTESTELAVVYQATGDLFIKSVTIEELPVWRFSRLLIALVLFALLDGFLWFFFISEKHGKTDRLSVMAGILCVGFSSLLAVNSKIVISDDLLHHLSRFIQMSDSLFAGQLPVRLHMSAINSFGSPTPLFYSELFLTLPAVLYGMAFPVQTSYQVYVITVNAFTYLIAYTCFKRISRHRRIAAVGACLYTLAAYRLTCLYERSAVGEYTAMVFLPLIVYGLWKLYTEKDDARFSFRSYAPLVLGLSGVIQSNIPSVVMSAVVVVLFCLIAIRKTLKPRRLLALIKTVLWTLAVNLWFLLPLVDSLSMPLNTNQSTVPLMIGSRAAEPVYLLGGLSQGFSTFDDILQNAFALGLPLVAGLAVFLAAVCKRRDWKLAEAPSYRAAMYAFVLSVICLWMSSVYFPWDGIAAIGGTIAYYFCSIQFPWRYLGYASVFAAAMLVLLLTALVQRGMQRRALGISAVLLTICVIVAGTIMAYTPARLGYQAQYSNLPQNAVDYHAAVFAPQNSNLGALTSFLHTPSAENATLESYDIQNEEYRVTVADARPDASVKLTRFYYEYYHAYDQDSGEEFTLRTAEDKTIEVVVPEGYEGTIVLRYVPPVSWRIAEIVSLLAAAACIVLYVKSKRQRKTK